MVYGNYNGRERRKNKANQACPEQRRMEPILNATTVFYAYFTRDCHGPSGLARAFFGGFLQRVPGEIGKIVRST